MNNYIRLKNALRKCIYILVFTCYTLVSNAGEVRGTFVPNGSSGGNAFSKIHWAFFYAFVKDGDNLILRIFDLRYNIDNSALYGSYTKQSLGLSYWPDLDVFYLHGSLEYEIQGNIFTTYFNFNTQEGYNHQEFTITAISNLPKGTIDIRSDIPNQLKVKNHYSNTGPQTILEDLIIKKNKEQGKNYSTPSTSGGIIVKSESKDKNTSNREKESNDDKDNEVSSYTHIPRKTESQLQYERLATNFYANSQASAASRNIKNLSKLEGIYETVEQVENAYQQQAQQIEYEKQNYQYSAQVGSNTGVDYLFSGGDANSKAIGEFTKSLGNVLNNAAAEKKARQAQEELNKQRDAQLKAIKERRDEAERKRWNALVAARKEVFAAFSEGGTPLSSHKISKNEVYMFAYSVAPADLSKNQPMVYVSNVYPVGRYTDGGWPFKNKIKEELTRASGNKSNIVIIGYYTDKKEAESVRSNFTNLIRKCEMSFSGFEYKGRIYNGSNNPTNDNDFWNDAPKKDENKSNDDFWK